MPTPFRIDITNGQTFNKLMNYVNLQYQTNREPIGFRIDNSSSAPKVQRIDRNFNDVDPEPDFFYNHELFQFPRCILTADGKSYYGSNIRGDGIDNAAGSRTIGGTTYYGDVMACIQNPKMRYEYDATSGEKYYLFAPYDSNHPYFNYHPHCYSGGTLHDHFFLGAKESSLGVSASGTKILRSVNGAQPLTGGQIRSIPFTNGNVEFVVGETITGATSGATGIVIAYYLSSGAWTGTAAGTVYIKNPGVDATTATAFTNTEALTRTAGSATSGASSVLGFTIDNALTYAANKGAGWTITDIHCLSLLKGLFFTQYGTRDSQSAIGAGVTNVSASIPGFAGANTGADNIDTLLNIYGTGTGTGINNGLSPVSWNNIENLWGNCWKYVAGINLMADGTTRVLKKDWNGTIAGTLVSNSYDVNTEIMPLTPSSGGFISTIQDGTLGSQLFLPKTAGDALSSNATYFCDFLYPQTADLSILFSGGNWISVTKGGINCQYAQSVASYSTKNLCARLKYIPQA